MPGKSLPFAVAAAALAAGAPCALADISYLDQNRSITAATSADANTQTLFAPDFAPFVESLNLSTTFDAVGGGTGINAAGAGIDCQLDPNAIVVTGSLSGAGGLSVTGGSPKLVFSESAVRISTSFHLNTDTPYSLLATARPSSHPNDRFKIKVEDVTHNLVLVFVDESMPPQAIDTGGIMLAGDYSLEFEAQLTIEGEETLKDFAFNLQVPSTGAPALAVIAGAFGLRRRR